MLPPLLDAMPTLHHERKNQTHTWMEIKRLVKIHNKYMDTCIYILFYLYKYKNNKTSLSLTFIHDTQCANGYTPHGGQLSLSPYFSGNDTATPLPVGVYFRAGHHSIRHDIP